MTEQVSRVSNLRTLLEAYAPEPGEIDSVAAVLALISAESHALSDDHYDPGHVTASAFVIDRSHTRLLLIHHGKLHLWLQPGGHVDAGEEVLAAAVREVEEETGIVAVPFHVGLFDVDVHAIPANGGRPPHNHYDVRFLLEATNEDFSDSDEVLGVRWVLFDDVPDLAADTSVLRPTAKLKRLFNS